MTSYHIPSESITVEQRVKRSLFICYIAHCTSRTEAETFIREISEKHNDANHNCWAHIAGSPNDPNGYGMNDDGEPKGCAGKPMFNVLHHSGIGEICAVVTRYFGGIKLGTGGMARAYSSTVQLGLEQLKTTQKIHYSDLKLTIPYNMLKTVEHILAGANGKIIDSSYSSEIRLDIKIPKENEETFKKQISDAGLYNL